MSPPTKEFQGILFDLPCGNFGQNQYLSHSDKCHWVPRTLPTIPRIRRSSDGDGETVRPTRAARLFAHPRPGKTTAVNNVSSFLGGANGSSTGGTFWRGKSLNLLRIPRRFSKKRVSRSDGDEARDCWSANFTKLRPRPNFLTQRPSDARFPRTFPW